jgi:hypothetical protein
MATFHHYDSKGGYAGKSTDEPRDMPGCGCIFAFIAVGIVFLFFVILSAFVEKGSFWDNFWGTCACIVIPIVAIIAIAVLGGSS